MTLKLEEGDKGQTADEVARESVKGLEEGREMVTCEVLGGLMWRAGMGSSRKSGWGVWDTLVGWVILVVMGWVRWDMDNTVRKWGRGEIKEVVKPKEAS